MPVYEIHQLKPELCLIVWCGFPNASEGQQFIQALKNIVENAERPVSFISDLRRGYIKDTALISKLSKVMAHPNCGITASFGSAGAQVFVGVTHRLLQRAKRNDYGWATLDEALKCLEHLQPGLTAGVDWTAFVV